MDGTDIDDLMEVVELSAEQSFSSDFAFSHLIVIGIGAQAGFRREKGSLKCRVCHHAERIQVSKVKSLPFLFPGAEGASAKGKIRIQPAVVGNEKLRPVVRTDGNRSHGKSGLPARGNPRNAAHGDEQKGLYAAVPLSIDCTGFCDIIQKKIFWHIGIGYLRGNKFINFSGTDQGVGLPADDLRSEDAQTGSETDVRKLLAGIEIRKTVGNEIGIRLHIVYDAVIFIFHPEGIIFCGGFLKGDGSGGSVRRAEEGGTVSRIQNADVAGGSAFLRNRQMDKNLFPRLEEFVPDAQTGLQVDAVFQRALFF